ADDAQRIPAAVGLRRIAWEPLVGHVGVVLEWAQRLHDVDAAALSRPGQSCRQLRPPSGGIHQRREVDVVRHPTFLEVGAKAWGQLIADLEREPRTVVERPLDVLAPVVGHGDVDAVVLTHARLLPQFRSATREWRRIALMSAASRE